MKPFSLQDKTEYLNDSTHQPKKKSKEKDSEAINENSSIEAGKLIEEIYEKTIDKLEEIIQEIKEQFYLKLETFKTEYKKSLRHQIQQLKLLHEEELLENLTKLKEQIRSKHDKLINLKESLQVQLNPRFYIESIFKLPQPQLPQRDEAIEPNLKKKNKNNNKCEYTCPKCSKKFWFRLDFGAHLNSAHNLIMKFKCPSCPFFEFDYMKLTPHLFEAHGIDSPESFHNKIYICPITQKQFSLRPPLSYFIRDNINYRVYE